MALTVMLALAAQSLGEPFMRYPDIHGSQVVFTSESDLWLGDLTTGKARRLTSDAGIERNAAFSPDGSQIAFEAEYDGQRQAYVMPAEGGVPRRLTSVENFRAVTGWTSDGKNVVFRASSVPTNYAYSTVPAAGGVATQLPLEFASHVSYAPTGGAFCFTRFNRWAMAWFRYIGGMQNQIWTYTPGGDKPFRAITDVEGTNEYPVWVGEKIWFANESKGHFALMSVPSGGGKPSKAFDSAMEIRELSTDGKKVIFEAGRSVMVMDPASGKCESVKFEMNSDLIHARPNMTPAEESVQDASLTPTAKRLLVEARGQIVSVPVGEGEARVLLAKPGVRYRHPAMSNDGKKMTYVDDSTGEQQLYVSSADGTSPKQVTKRTEGQIWGPRFSPDGKWISYTDSEMRIQLVNLETSEAKTVATLSYQWREAPYEFSPDSQWVVYSQYVPVTALRRVELYHVPSGKTYPVTDGRANDIAPAFSDDGKYLVYASLRRISASPDPLLNQLNLRPPGMICLVPLRADGDDPLAPKDTDEPKEAKKEEDKKPEFKIDLEGLFARRVELPIAPDAITKVAMAGTRVIYAGESAIKYFDIAAKAGGDLAAGGSFELSGDNKSVLIGGRQFTVVGVDGSARKPVTFGGLRLRVEPMAEWREMFWDAWRHLRDYFYDAKLHGLDWKQIGDKYAALLPSVRSRGELDELIRWMQAEMGSSHQYLSPGDELDLKPRVPGAYLGCQLVWDPAGAYRIAKIYGGDGYLNSERSPLLGAGKNIKEGMYLLAIGGERLRGDADPYEKLAGRAGQTVSLLVGERPTGEGKTYLVRPVASESRMKYLSWVEANRKYVEQKSGGKLGYLHLAAMGTGDMNDFVRQYFYQRDKDGFVIDGRFNNGGFVQDYINRILNESLTGFFNQRNSPLSWTRQDDYFTGPMALLINEFDISCGEEFPHRFRDLKRGKLIGRRTMGGEVGSDPGWQLADGGSVNVPNYGMYTPDGKWAIEGLGVSPDFDVPSDPNAFIRGVDPQIDRAIAYLLEEVKKKGQTRGVVPPSKDRVKNPGG